MQWLAGTAEQGSIDLHLPDLDGDSNVLGSFVGFLHLHCNTIAEEWLASIARDGRIPQSARMWDEDRQREIINLFSTLAAMVGAPLDAAIRGKASEIARSYGHGRWEQGFRLDQLQRELMRLREAFVGQSISFEEEHPGFSGLAKRVAIRRLHSCFTEVSGEIAEHFVRLQQADAENKAKDAEELNRLTLSDLIRLREVDSSRLHLLRTTAHELRNLLNAAQLCVEDLTDANPAIADHSPLSMLSRNIGQMNEVLADLLEFSVLASGRSTLRISLVSSKEFAEELLISFQQRAAEKNLRLEYDCDAALKALETDGTKLKQVAVNLLSNAIKYTDRGWVNFWLRTHGDTHWKFGVADSGPGLDADAQNHLFDEFFRVTQTANREGTGLGLPIVKRLVGMLGGTIEVESSLGCGSRFEVILPRRHEMHPTAQPMLMQNSAAGKSDTPRHPA